MRHIEKKPMKKTTIIAVWATVIALTASITQAEEHETPGAVTNQPSPWGYSASVLLTSEYYGSIFGGIFYPGPMSWTDLVASRKDKVGALTFDLSIGQKLDRINQFNRDGGNEYDFTVDHSFSLGSKPWQVLGDAGVCYLALHDLGRIKDDCLEEFVRLDFPVGNDKTGSPIIQPYMEAFHFHDVGDGLHNEGWWTYGGAFRNQPLGCKVFDNELKLNIDFRVGASAGAYGSKTGIEYYRIAFTLPFAKGKWTVAPSLIFQTPGSSGRPYVHNNEDHVFYALLIKRTL